MKALVALLALTCSVTIWAQDTVRITPKDVIIDAAFRFNGRLFLISGSEYMTISPDGFEAYVMNRTGVSEVPVVENIQAAVTWPGKPLVYFLCTRQSFKNNQTSRTSKRRPYRRGREFLQDGGPDAAAFKSGAFYIFKGCRYVAPRGTMWFLGPEEAVTPLGLPCNIDAAWTDPDFRGMTVLKGDQIWQWRDNETLRGPHPFHEVYHIWSWRLLPLQDDRFHL